MNAREYPFYGLGIVAFSVAEADGEIQAFERNELREIIKRWSRDIEADFDVAEIIFSLLSKTKHSDELNYATGMKYIATGSSYLTASLKERFVYLIRDIAHAFPPVTESELTLVRQFEADLHKL